eukprot:45611-Eustigmatos_ZCMA.PRE.1
MQTHTGVRAQPCTLAQLTPAPPPTSSCRSCSRHSADRTAPNTRPPTRSCPAATMRSIHACTLYG